jgi:hypothetical protein
MSASANATAPLGVGGVSVDRARSRQSEPPAGRLRAEHGRDRLAASPVEARVRIRGVVLQDHDDEFDRWVVAKGGPEAVVAMIEDIKRRVAEGSLPAFWEEEPLLEYWAGGRRQSA